MDGRCLCGAITVTISADPIFVGHCHCESCRRQSGSIPATFVGFSEEHVSYTGTVREHESSPGIFRGFCATCGSAVHYRRPGEIHLYIGIFDDPSRYQPTFHVHYQEHIDGYEMSDDLPRFKSGTSSNGGEPIAWGPLKGG